MLKKNSEVTTHFMHSRYGNINLICPKYKRELDGGRSFTISAIRLWNSLPKAIREVKTESLFKKSLLCFLNPVMRTETILVSKLFLSTYYFVVRYILFDACFDVIVLYIINSSFNYLRGPQICQSILLRVTLVK